MRDWARAGVTFGDALVFPRVCVLSRNTPASASGRDWRDATLYAHRFVKFIDGGIEVLADGRGVSVVGKSGAYWRFRVGVVGGRRRPQAADATCVKAEP